MLKKKKKKESHSKSGKNPLATFYLPNKNKINLFHNAAWHMIYLSFAISLIIWIKGSSNLTPTSLYSVTEILEEWSYGRLCFPRRKTKNILISGE